MKSWWHCVRVHKSNNLAANVWCQDQFGPRWSITDNRSGVWTLAWVGPEDWSYYQFAFANQADAVAFALKWT